MKNKVLFFLVGIALTSSYTQASVSGKYRIESTESVVDAQGTRRCIVV